jgi:hypothetical protein
MDTHQDTAQHTPIERVQIGARMEKRLVKVLKGLAEYHDLALGDLLEGIVLHAFEGRSPFHEESLRKIAQLKEVYGMNYGVEASHRLTEIAHKEGQK